MEEEVENDDQDATEACEETKRIDPMKLKYPNSLNISGMGRKPKCPCPGDEDDAGEGEDEVVEEEEEEEETVERIPVCPDHPPLSREIIPPDFSRHRLSRPHKIVCYPPKEARAPEPEEEEPPEEEAKKPPRASRWDGTGSSCAQCPISRPRYALPPAPTPTPKTRCYDPEKAERDKSKKRYRCDGPAHT